MTLHERSSADHATAGLSGHVVGRLGTGEQLVLWALRQRLRDGEPASPVLVRGFRLAFGLAELEPALAAFEDLCRALDERAAGPDPWLLPLRCAYVSAGERTVLALVASAQAGKGPGSRSGPGRSPGRRTRQGWPRPRPPSPEPCATPASSCHPWRKRRDQRGRRCTERSSRTIRKKAELP